MASWKTDIYIALLLLVILPVTVLAQSSSANYSIEEFFVGPGGATELDSANYSARASLGDTGVGNSTSANYQIYGGFTTTNDPYLELVVNASTIDMGVIDASTTGYGIGTFSVRSYLASEYTVFSDGGLPTNEQGDTIDGIAVRAAHSQGTEQFGMNLTVNTDPAAYGANPVQVPDGTFSFGAATADYAVADEYKYVEGDAIASSATSSGQTDYTIAYVLNVSGITEAGLYTTNQTVVVTSSF